MSTHREISSGQLAKVAAIVADASHCDELPDSLNVFVEGLVELTGCDRAVVLLEEGARLVTCYADKGSRHLVAREVPLEGSVEGQCYREGRPVVSSDISRDGRFEGMALDADELSLIAVPLHLEGPPVGLVRLASAETSRFTGRDLMAARLVVAAMRKLLLQSLRTQRELLGIHDKGFANAGVWALRDRRTAQLRNTRAQSTAIALVRYDIRGYLTADIIHHMAAVVRSCDHVFQDDAGTFTLILTGTSAADAEVVALRVKAEIQRMAEMGGDPVEVDWQVTELDHDVSRRRIA